MNTSVLSKSLIRAFHPGHSFENIHSCIQKPFKSHLYSQREKAHATSSTQRAFLMDSYPNTFQLFVKLSPAKLAKMFLQS